MKLGKRGVELSMNVVIIAAIALIVLVILVMFVMQAAKNVRGGTSCVGQGGECVALYEGETCASYFTDEGYRRLSSECPEGKTCCFKPLGGEGE